MSDKETPAGEQPQTTAPASPGAEQAQSQPLDVNAAIDGMTDTAEMASLLFGGGPSAPAKPEPPAPAATQTPADQNADPDPQPDDAGAQPQPGPGSDDAAPQDPQDEPQAAPTLDRISLKSLPQEDRQLIADAKEMVRTGKAASVAEAVIALTQQQGGSQQPDPQQAQEQTAPPEQPAQARQTIEQDQDVQAITQKIADLRAERKKAIEEYDRNAEIELTAQIEDQLANLSEAKAQAVLRNRDTQQQQQTMQAVVESVYHDYPESEDPTSYFSYRMTQEVEAFQATNGSIAHRPQHLRTIAAKVAAEIGQAKPTGKPAATPSQPQPPPRQTARPVVGAAAPGSAAASRPSPDQIQNLMETADADTLRVALFGA